LTRNRAVVVFSGQGSHCLDPLLKSGFRHTFCVIDDGAVWVCVDARQGVPHIYAMCASDSDIAKWYRAEGYTVVETHTGSGLRLPLVLSNCVGLVKASLGLHFPFTVTPYQLYKRLNSGAMQ
jgi:hypothetical protein